MGRSAAAPSASARPAELRWHWLRVGQAQLALEQEPGAVAVAALARRRVLRWAAIAGLAWRALAYPPALLQALHEGHARVPTVALIPLGLILVGNLALLMGVLWRGSTRLLETKTFCMLDIAVALGLNLW